MQRSSNPLGFIALVSTRKYSLIVSLRISERHLREARMQIEKREGQDFGKIDDRNTSFQA